MSDTDKGPPDDEPLGEGAKDEETEALDDDADDAMRKLLKRSLVEPAETQVPDLVSGVQRKLRKRSRGKFYADGWSTSSRTNYVLVAVAMLLVIAIAYLVLGPTGISVH